MKSFELKRKEILILSGVSLCLLVWGALVLLPWNGGTVRNDGGCEVREKTSVVKEPGMAGLIPDGAKVRFLYGWYNCHAPEKGDLVLYRFSEKMDPIVRVVRAVEGDHFKLSPDSNGHAWNLLINGKAVMAGDKPYFFGAASPPTLSLYVKSHNGILQPGEVILLSSVPPGSLDSGVLGLRQIRDVMAKVELISR
jgi:hypothetical protein